MGKFPSTWRVLRWHFTVLELLVIGALLLIGWATPEELEERPGA